MTPESLDREPLNDKAYPAFCRILSESELRGERVRGWCPARSSKPVRGLETGSWWVRFPCAPAIIPQRLTSILNR
jgi:hypothetical protein